MPRAVFALIPLLALGLTATAVAQDATSAGERFRRAVARYESSQYDEALADFQQLYEDTEEPALLYNIARCQEQLGDLDSASTSMRRYLDRVPDADDREEAAQLLADIDARRQAGVNPPPVEDDPPQVDPDPAPQPEPDPPAETHTADDSGLSPLALTGITLLAVGGASVIVGATLGGLTAAEDSTLREDGCGVTRTCTDDDLSGLHTLGTGADVGLFVGGAVVVAGVVLLIVGLADDGDAAQALLQQGARF